MDTSLIEPTTASTQERNKAVWRRYIDIIDRHALDELAEVVAPGFVAHDLPPDTPRGPDGLRGFRERVHQAFPDARTTIDDLLADGDKVVGRFTIEATHSGPFMGFAPTGKRISLGLIEIARLENGKIVERWAERDFLALLRQLGLFPAPS
jgi:predicted ester cyclase